MDSLFENKKYWKKRSEKYNKLEWVTQNTYLDNICNVSNLNAKHIVLDVGSGTGAVSNYIKEKVQKVMALDISPDMLREGEWENVSIVNWDIRDVLFGKNIFDIIFARMVFHHITEGLLNALNNCFNYLKTGGKIVVAEAVPPSDEKEIVLWFDTMFKKKEDRITFTASSLTLLLRRVGFHNITVFSYFMNNFSINNWIENSGLPQKKIQEILEIHKNAPNIVKQAYDMKIKDSQINVNSKYIVVVAEK